MAYYKREILAFCNRSSGLMRLLGVFPKRPMLLVLNYHRIGDPAQTEYDAGVYSATAEGLAEQLRFLKRRFDIVNLEEALEMIEARTFRRTAVLLTFDDGYRDNYEAAYPVLRAHGAQGVFFLPTAFIGTDRVAPWDAIAFIARRSRRRRFRLPFAPLREFDLDADGTEGVIKGLLQLYKSNAVADRFIPELEDACDAARPGGSERLFMNWEEAAELLEGGMALGSHSHTHPALSQLSGTDLLRELTLSKAILERQTRKTIHCVSYPFGLQATLSPEVFAAAEAAGYRAAFSFFGGYNLPGKIRRFNVLREAVCPAEGDVFQIKTTLTSMAG